MKKGVLSALLALGFLMPAASASASTCHIKAATDTTIARQSQEKSYASGMTGRSKHRHHAFSGKLWRNNQSITGNNAIANPTIVRGHDQNNSGNSGHNRRSNQDNSNNRGNQLISSGKYHRWEQNNQRFSGNNIAFNANIYEGHNQGNSGNSGVNQGVNQDNSSNNGNQIIN